MPENPTLALYSLHVNQNLRLERAGHAPSLERQHPDVQSTGQPRVTPSQLNSGTTFRKKGLHFPPCFPPSTVFDSSSRSGNNTNPNKTATSSTTPKIRSLHSGWTTCVTSRYPQEPRREAPFHTQTRQLGRETSCVVQGHIENQWQNLTLDLGLSLNP